MAGKLPYMVYCGADVAIPDWKAPVGGLSYFTLSQQMSAPHVTAGIQYSSNVWTSFFSHTMHQLNSEHHNMYFSVCTYMQVEHCPFL